MTGPSRWPSLREGQEWGCPPPICRFHHKNEASVQNIQNPGAQTALPRVWGAPKKWKTQRLVRSAVKLNIGCINSTLNVSHNALPK